MLLALQHNIPLVVAFLYALLNLINALISNPEAKSIVGKLIDGMSFLTRAQAPGTLKLPGTLSSGPSAAPPGVSTLLMLAPVLLLTGCAFGQCMLGKLQADKQILIEEVTAGLATDDYVTALAKLTVSVGSDAVTCTVQAIVAYEQSKQPKPAAGGARMLTAPSPILDHGQSWLGAHRPVACAPRGAA